MHESPQSLDNFIIAFGQFMKTGDTEALSAYCDNGTNPDLFNIYRNGFYRACIDALASNYPAIVALLGGTYFRTLAKNYVNQWPPEVGTLAGYGENFAEFIELSSVSHNLPYLADVARLDRAWLEVYFSFVSTPLIAERIAEMASEGVEIDLERLTLSKSSALLSLNYPVAEIWRKLKDFGHIQEVVELPRERENILLWRYDSEVLLRTLQPKEYQFFSSFKDGLIIEQAIELAYGDDAELEMNDLFLNLIAAGLLTADKISNQPHHREPLS